MTTTTLPGGTFAMAEGLTVSRMGYGAMQFAGPHVFGPPADRDAAVAVLREVVELGSPTSTPATTTAPRHQPDHQRSAAPLSRRLADRDQGRRLPRRRGRLARRWRPKSCARPSTITREPRSRGARCRQPPRRRARQPDAGSIAEPFTVLAEMQQEGLIKHLGVSTVTAEQIAEAQSIAPIVCVQNFYNIAHRVDDALIDSLAEQGIAYVPYFPLGGFTPLHPMRWIGRPGSTRPRWRSRWPGCCSAPPTSCSSPVPPPSCICARTSRRRRSPVRGGSCASWTALPESARSPHSVLASAFVTVSKPRSHRQRIACQAAHTSTGQNAGLQHLGVA